MKLTDTDTKLIKEIDRLITEATEWQRQYVNNNPNSIVGRAIKKHFKLNKRNTNEFR